MKEELLWTGERFIPWMELGEIHYEHLHRYAFAAQFVKGRRVLDLACGEGYGSKILSSNAAHVVGIDIDKATIEHARKKYTKKNLEFMVGSMMDIPVKDNNQFDVIVCFEAIEHIKEQEMLLNEVKRLLKKDGLFIVSTPDKRYFEEKIKDKREFHVKELYFDEFKELLNRYFKNIAFYGQHLYLSSIIWSLDRLATTSYTEFIIEQRDNEFYLSQRKEKIPVFLIAVASDLKINISNSNSFLIERENNLLNKKDMIISDISKKDDYIESLRGAIEEKDRNLKAVYGELEERDRRIKSLEEIVEEKRNTLQKLYVLIEEKNKSENTLKLLLDQRQEEIERLSKELCDLKNIAVFKVASKMGLIKTR